MVFESLGLVGRLSAWMRRVSTCSAAITHGLVNSPQCREGGSTDEA